MKTSPSNTKKYYILGFFIVAFGGTLAHFVYNWSGKNPVLGLFFPVSESTWEHMKLIFFPMLLWGGTFFHVFRKENSCFPYLLLSATLLGTGMIPVLFYSYSGILGAHFPALDIATFYVSLLFSFTELYKTRDTCYGRIGKIVLVVLTIIAVLCFFIFSYHAPDYGIFRVPSPNQDNSP
ncbi:MAG: hypothetical protein J5988_10270 [Eubacterium sp.]|nr:hypothetical protein [Eubacterium sp.]